jgi:hypothetical protein
MRQIQKDKEDTIKNDIYNININTLNGNDLTQGQRLPRTLVPPNTTLPPRPPNKYSPQYANYIGARTPASASARIKLGGVY